MIGFDIEVNIYSNAADFLRKGITATFSGPEYNECKRLASKFAKDFRQKDSRCDFFFTYNIFDEEGRRKNGTTMLVKELP